MDPAALSAQNLLGELARAAPSAHAPSMGKIQKVRYSHMAMIDMIISDPWISQNELAARFGYSPSWISNVLASDAFQSMLAQRRDEIVDPAIKATIEERFRALVLQSLEVLKRKLDIPDVKPDVALRAAELGAKALGLGGHAPPPRLPEANTLEVLAQRLVALKRQNDQPRLTQEVRDEIVIEGALVPEALPRASTAPADAGEPHAGASPDGAAEGR